MPAQLEEGTEVYAINETLTSYSVSISCIHSHNTMYIYIYIYLKKLTIEANLYSTINKVKVAGFFIPKAHMAFRLILFSELTSGK